MSRVKDFAISQQLLSVRPADTALDAARLMTRQRVGAVLVIESGKLLGLFSERDLMARVISAGLSAETTRIEQVMTTNPVVVDSETTAEQCLRLMNQIRCRHLPVMADGKPVGMVSIRDLMLHRLRAKDDEIQMMRAFIHDVPPSSPKTSE
jgi:CBS domain-containing protein